MGAHLIGKIPKFNLFFCLLGPFFYFVGCNSNPMTHSKVSLSPIEQKRLLLSMDRYDNGELYSKNLSKLVRPNEKHLFKEARFKDQKAYKESVDVLIEWYEKKLSKHDLMQLAKNCSAIVGNFSEQFPLTERSLACAGWWLDKKSGVNQKKEVQNIQLPTKNKESLSSSDLIKWTKYKNMSFIDAMSNIHRLNDDQVSAFVKKATTTHINCAYTNTYASLMFKLEDYLPNDTAFKDISQIYKHTTTCFKANGPLTERVNLRLGVLNLLRGDYQAAHKALKKNQFEKAPQDESRNLFWLGAIEYQKDKNANNVYWKKLVETNPLGLFAIIASEHMKRDPLDSLVDDKSIPLQNRIFGGWNPTNLQAFVFDLLLAKEEKIAAKNLAAQTGQNLSKFSPNLYLYWSLNNSELENSRMSIFILSKYFENQKKPRLSRGLLELNFPVRYSQEILHKSAKVDPLLVLALIRQESAFDSSALSYANARGLMQLVPETANALQKNVAVKKLYEPQKNIELGILYLEKLFEKYQGRTEYVLAAYNAGPGRVNEWTDRIKSANTLLFMEYVPFRETRNYISTIIRNYYWYKRLMDGQRNTPFARLYLEKNLASKWKPEKMVAILEENYTYQSNKNSPTTGK